MKADTESRSHTAVPVEVLVIGGGVIGSSIAYHVARQGRKVLVVERQEVAVEYEWMSESNPCHIPKTLCLEQCNG